jgi:hypothetical protein
MKRTTGILTILVLVLGLGVIDAAAQQTMTRQTTTTTTRQTSTSTQQTSSSTNNGRRRRVRRNKKAIVVRKINPNSPKRTVRVRSGSTRVTVTKTNQ